MGSTKRTTGKSGRAACGGRARRSRQVAEWIREKVILPGRPGDVLPTERELARALRLLIGKSRLPSVASISWPTAPVAPATATV